MNAQRSAKATDGFIIIHAGLLHELKIVCNFDTRVLGLVVID